MQSRKYLPSELVVSISHIDCFAKNRKAKVEYLQHTEFKKIPLFKGTVTIVIELVCLVKNSEQWEIKNSLYCFAFMTDLG